MLWLERIFALVLTVPGLFLLSALFTSSNSEMVSSYVIVGVLWTLIMGGISLSTWFQPEQWDE